MLSEPYVQITDQSGVSNHLLYRKGLVGGPTARGMVAGDSQQRTGGGKGKYAPRNWHLIGYTRTKGYTRGGTTS